MTAGPERTHDAVRFDDAVALADEVMTLRQPILVAFDVDGVLAPIVGHAADAALLPGLLDSLIELSTHTPVGVVSGRAIENLERFGFPDAFMVAGSHGAERRGTPLRPLTTTESRRLSRLRVLADRAAVDAGPGAWVEAKPTGVVLHVRESNLESGARALNQLAGAAAAVAGATVKRGHAVVEVTTRPATKATAIKAMRLEVPPGAVVFLGDDVTDEDVFRSLTDDDLGIRVGRGVTLASRRLRSPQAVLTFVRRLVARLSTAT